MGGGDLGQTQWKSYHAGNNTFQNKMSTQTQNAKANNITTSYTEIVEILYFRNVMLIYQQPNFNCCIIYNYNIVLGGVSETQHKGIVMFETFK